MMSSIKTEVRNGLQYHHRRTEPQATLTKNVKFAAWFLSFDRKTNKGSHHNISYPRMCKVKTAADLSFIIDKVRHLHVTAE